MALCRILQRGSVRLPHVCLPSQTPFLIASFSDRFDQKERAAEKSYFKTKKLCVNYYTN
ncbi:unnamed protein product [Albugo candida]|uniref:Uncharacterized protein n=1 Tax=Albugo candida TaxID=65357 RepID=A0A024GL57_9STRA|nr:unnamed protein product [Albugo candida]|eukprot:CCI47488.1 unnamed protein product [Albugo candida]